MGVLGTKKRFLNRSRSANVESASSVHSSPNINEIPDDFLHTEILGEAFQPTDHDGHGLFPSDERQGMHGLDIGMESSDHRLHSVDKSQPAGMSQDLIGAAQHELLQDNPIGDMYHDLTFDLVHFNVTGFTTPRSDIYLATDAGHIVQLGSRPRPDPSLEIPFGSPSYGVVDTAFSPGRGPSHARSADQLDYPDETPAAGRNLLLGSSPTTAAQQARRESHLPENRSPLSHRSSFTSPFEQSRNTPSISSTAVFNKLLLIAIPSNKRAELVELIVEIRPVRPDGTLMNADSPEFSLTSMQTYLDSFFKYFNTSYPILHVPTLDICNLDPIALLSFIIMGATYQDKHAHQLSVCLYDAIIPYIFSGLLSSMLPDLAILQAFMVLECYGMYRAGPYQRENAILIHRLLLNVSSLDHCFIYILC